MNWLEIAKKSNKILAAFVKLHLTKKFILQLDEIELF